MKRILLFTLVTALMLGLSLPVLADELQDLQNKKSSVDKRINSAIQQKKEAAQEKKALESRMNSIKSTQTQEKQEYEGLLGNLDEINAEIARIDADIAQAERDYEKQREEVKDRLRYMYENSDSSVFETLLNAKSIIDFFDRLELMSLVAKIDKQAIESLAAAQKDIEFKKQMQEDRKKGLQEAASLKKERLEKLTVSRAELDARIRESQTKINRLERQIDELNRESDKLVDYISSLSKRKNYVEGDMVWPLSKNSKVVSSFGMRPHPILKKKKMHTGIDIDGNKGDSIFAANKGTVIISKWQNGYGNTVVIDHGGGITTLYAHCSKLLVKAGDEVKVGQVIAKVGSTGLSTGPHLHFEVRKNGKPQNPLEYVSR